MQTRRRFWTAWGDVMHAIVWLLVRLGLIEVPAFVATIRRYRPQPDALAPGQMVVVKAGGLQKWTCFRCPGGCGEAISLSMSPARVPRWFTTLDWLNRPTVAPSIRKHNECGCHFWIERGGVQWCIGGRPKREQEV